MKSSQSKGAKSSKPKGGISALNCLLLGIIVITVIILALHMSHITNVLDPINASARFISSRVVSSISPEIKKNTLVESPSPETQVTPPVNIAAVEEHAIPVPQSTISTKDVSYDLPGAAQHKILTLSDNEFFSKSVRELMGWYGQANGGGTCSEDFGNQLADKWRATKAPYCRPTGPAATASSIDCYLVHQSHHHGTGDNLCLMRNVSVQLGLFGSDAFTRPIVENYVKTQHMVQPYPKLSPGFIQAACQTAPERWTRPNFPGWNLDWTINAVQSVSKIGDDGSSSSSSSAGLRGGSSDENRCDEWVEHPVLVVQRDTFANFFHDSEDFVNVFLAMSILDWNKRDTQLLLTDLYPKGPFWEIWDKPFSGAFKTMDAWDIRQKYGKQAKGESHRVCFRQLAVGIYGPASPITVASWDTPCSNTALVRAYADYVIRGLNLQEFTHYKEPKPLKKVVVTYLARRASTEWPEKRFCDSENSFFLCELWATWGIRSLGRMIQNDKDFVASLKELETKTYKNGAEVVFQDVDFNLLTLEEQIKVDLQTDILIGPHGAGLMHTIFMRDRATLMELQVDGSGVNRHFHNLAAWAGKKYLGVGTGNPVDVRGLNNLVIRVIEELNLDSY